MPAMIDWVFPFYHVINVRFFFKNLILIINFTTEIMIEKVVECSYINKYFWFPSELSKVINTTIAVYF